MGKRDPTILERFINLFRGEKKTESPRMSYGKHGASQTLNSMVGWLVDAGNAEDDIDLFSSTLRKRARDLYAGGGLARSGPQSLTTSVVGWGIQPKPKIDGEQKTPCVTRNGSRTFTDCSSWLSCPC